MSKIFYNLYTKHTQKSNHRMLNTKMVTNNNIVSMALSLNVKKSLKPHKLLLSIRILEDGCFGRRRKRSRKKKLILYINKTNIYDDDHCY